MLSNKPFLLKIFLLLISIETAWTAFMLISIPSDSKNAVLLGFSSARLLLLGIVVLFFSLSSIFLVYISISSLGFNRIERLLNESRPSWKFSAFLWLLVIICVFGILFFLTPPERIGEAMFERLFPVVCLSILLSLQTLLFQFVWFGRKLNFNFLLQWKSVYLTAGITFVIIFFAWVFIVWSKIGLVPEKTGWAPPGTPVLPQQVLLALGLGSFFYLCSKHWQWIKNYKRVDLVVGIALWGIASILWHNEPLRDWSYFTAEPTPPNFEVYPYSDAALYDIFSQNYLIGTSLDYGLTHRPGYAIFLAWLHAIAGQDYDIIVMVQTLILAVGPVLLYLLASMLGGRSMGIIAALLIIFREKNAIALTNVIEVSHSKLLMSDVPTMMLMIAFVYFLIKWLKDTENKFYLGMITGAALGFAALIRSQALICIPIVIFCFLVAKRKNIKTVIIQSLSFLLGVLLVVTPWVLRNYQVSGRMVIEYQNAYTTVIASGYTNNISDIERLPGETVEMYDARMFAMIKDYIKENPLEVARFYLAYFIHNEISSIVYLPMSFELLQIKGYVRELNMWGWNPLFANPAPEILPVYFLTLGMIALGIGFSYQRVKWIGLLPLFIHLGYSFSVVPFKTSGWRFILPVDWIPALYFSIGLMHLILMLFSLFNDIPNRIEHKEKVTTEHTYRKTFQMFLVFLLIGLAFPLIENLIPKKYPTLTPNELLQTYFANDIVLANGQVVPVSTLEVFLETDPNSTILYGRALYPSFYQSGEYWGDDDSYPPVIRDISRLQFLVIGPLQRRVYIPLSEASVSLPHASDVVIIGCSTNAGVEALIVNVNETMFINNIPWRGLTCSTP